MKQAQKSFISALPEVEELMCESGEKVGAGKSR
jgi:hypothetical protein